MHGFLKRLWRLAPIIGMTLLPWQAWAADAQRVSLWEVRGDKATVYLFGSVHVCRASCYPLPASVMRAFNAAPELVVEVDPDTDDVSQHLLEAGALPPGRRLSDELDAADAAALAKALDDLKVPLKLVDGYRPWMAGTFISLMAAYRAGLSADMGVDLRLLALARASGKPIIELETAQRQIDALQAGDDEVQIEGLRQVLAMLREHRLDTYFDELISAWRRGDTDRLDTLVREAGGTDERWRAELLDARNEEMADKIAGWLDVGRHPFIVVGVGHLAGEGSLVDLLARRGYAVRQMDE